MCTSTPKIPKPPVAPPPPTAVAEKVETPSTDTDGPRKRKGAAGLVKRRMTIGTGVTDTGSTSNLNY